MRKTSIIVILSLFVFACTPRKTTLSSKQAKSNNQQVQKQNAADINGYTPQSSLQYIAKYKAIAIQQMNAYGIPASITLAQGLFESGSGNGELARVANNHFGIKSTSDWKGRVYYKDDDHPNDAFRVYNNAEDSFRDHSEFLKRKNYINLFELDKNDYRGWAYGLKKDGYATNPNYATLIINVIEKYNLHQYDTPEVEIQKIKRVDTVFAQIDKKAVKEAKDSVKAKNDSTLYQPHNQSAPVKAAPVVLAPIQQAPTQSTPAQPAPAQATTVKPATVQPVNAQNDPAVVNKMYTVKQGDTLYSLSRRFGLTVDDLKTMNNLPDFNIKIGQKLVVVK